ncbi:unnamed protein product, partial [Closterium sp. NIES-53]
VSLFRLLLRPLFLTVRTRSLTLRAASPTVTRFLATAVTDPLFESTVASALVAELVDFAAACRLDFATSLVAESTFASVCPPSVGVECALGTNVLEDRQEDFECFAATVPHLVSMLLAPEGNPDAPDIPTPHSYAEAIEGFYSSQWVKWPPGSPPVFKARYVSRGFSQRQGVEFFQTFSPTPKMTTLRWSLRRPVYGLRQAPREWHDTLRTTLAALGFAPSTADPLLFLRTDSTLPPFYVLVYVDNLVFATTDIEVLAHVKSELQKRHTCTDLGELTSYLGFHITRDRAQSTITLTQSHMVQQVLQRFGFTYSSPQSTPLPTDHSLSAPPSDESVEPSGPYPELVGCLMYLMTCTRPLLAYPLSLLACYVAPGRHRKVHWDAAKRVLHYLCSTLGMGLVLGGRARAVLIGHADASWVDDLATQRSSQGYTFRLGFGSVSWRSTRSSFDLNSSCEAEIYGGAMAAQELRWLTYLLTDLGEAPRSPPLLYVDNKAMLALCQEHRLEHRTKHIALRYFLAQELQQSGQLRLAYVSSQANTADVFTKALQPCDHQPCFAFLDWSCDLLFSPTLPMGYRCPSGCDGHYHHSWGSACVDLHVHTDGASLSYVHSSARVESIHAASKPPQVAASAQVSASGQVAASCLCRLLSHQTLLWHHRLGHPSLPCLRGMHSRLLVSGLPRSLPPLPPTPTPPCLPCIEGRQRAAPHSSSFPPMTAPLQTLHMDVWGPARVSGHGRERYFLLVVYDYTLYTTDFPLHSKGGEFSSNLLRDFCRREGITQSFTLPDSPQQNGIAERRIGLVMEVARTSMIHAAAPHFLWPFAVRYAAHQLNLWPRVSLPKTSPTLHWTGKVGDALVFRFYHPTSRRVLPSQDVTFDESVPFYRLFPYRSAPPPPPPLFLAPAVLSGAAPGTASGGAASRGAELGGVGSEGAGSGGAEPEGVEPGGAESEGAEPGGAESEGAKSRGAEPRGAPSFGGPAGASPRLSSQQLREWLVQLGDCRTGAGGAGAGVAGVGGPGTLGTGAAGAGAVDLGAGGARGTVQPRLYFVPLLQQVLGVPSSTGLPPPFLCPPPVQSQPPLQPASPLHVPSSYTEQSESLTERREPASRPVSPVRSARRAPRSHPPPVPGTHTMALPRAASPTVARLLATAVTDPSFESAAASALVAELLVFAAACRLDYASAIVAELSSLVTQTLPGMAAQELRWLADLLTDLGEQPHSPPQRGQLRLAYVATRANTADVFTKALPPGDHQRFVTVLGLLALLCFFS